jgi:elongator complex protein 1
MPRGNLEGIYPRIIVIKKAIEDIENLCYKDAFKSLRQHRIDLNLIYDVNPS